MKKKIEVNAVGAGSHVPVIENKLRDIKGYCRGIKNTLPYLLPLFLVTWLIYFAVSCINMVPNKGGVYKISPTEAFLGHKVDYKFDLRSNFGEMVEVTDPIGDNTLKSRTNTAIALVGTGNRTG